MTESGGLFLTFVEWICHGESNHPTTCLGFDEWLVAWSRGGSTANAFHDLGKPKTGLGKAVEIVFALAATVHDSPVPQEG